MPTIKMKKGYLTSDGVMHDKHADAVKAQVKINIDSAIERETNVQSDGHIDTMQFIIDNKEAVTDYLKYFCTDAKPKAAAPKKKRAKKPSDKT